MIFENSEGIPRNINNICFNSMSLGSVVKQRTIEVDVVSEVVKDSDLSALLSDPPAPRNSTNQVSELQQEASVPAAGFFLRTLRTNLISSMKAAVARWT